MKTGTLLAAIAAVTLLACQPACTTTVTPHTVQATVASVDGNYANGGLLGFVALSATGEETVVKGNTAKALQAAADQTIASGGTIKAWIITSRAAARYNLLCETYGNLWTPAIDAGYGLTPTTDGNYLLPPEALTKFIAMNAKAKMGAAQ